MKGKLIYYKDRSKQPKWRWRIVATNGNIVACSGEGYESKRGVQKGFAAVKRMARNESYEISGL